MPEDFCIILTSRFQINLGIGGREGDKGPPGDPGPMGIPGIAGPQVHLYLTFMLNINFK